MNTVNEAVNDTEQNRGGLLVRRDLIAVLIIIAVATLAALPLFIYGFPKGQDAVKHYRWSTEFAQAIDDGALYPRWLPDANRGMGSPLVIYYPPVPFYVAAAFNSLTKNMLRAMSWSCWLALMLSGLTMYGLSRVAVSPWAGLVAAVLYMLMPYHILDLYQGGAISEFWCFVWVPLIFYFIYQTGKQEGWRALRALVGLAVSYALLLQTHVPSAFLTSLALPIFAILLTRDWRRLLRIAAGLAFGAGLSAIFVVPVLFERKYIHIGRVLLRCNYRDYFLFKHLRSAFKTIVVPSEGSDYSLQADLAALAVLALLVVAGWLMWKQWRASGGDWRAWLRRDAGESWRVWLWRVTRQSWRAWWWRDEERDWRTRLGLAALVVAAGSLFMTTPLATPLYRVVPGLPFLLFPFRWLLLSSAGAALLTAAAVSLLVRNVERRTLNIVALIVITAFALTVSSLAIARMPQKPATLERRLARRETPEYHPIWWDGERDEDFDETSVVVDSGDAVVQSIDDSGIKQSYAVNASSESRLRLRPLYFPGWVARVDGRPIGISPSENGNIELTIEPGEHQLTLSFEDTWPRKTGKVISAVCLAGLLGLLVVAWRAKRRAEPTDLRLLA